MSDITYGGFFRFNIRRALLQQILESGKPGDMMYAMHEELVDLLEEWEDSTDNLADTQARWWGEVE